MVKSFVSILLLGWFIHGNCQPTKSKYSIGIRMEANHHFTQYLESNTHWKGAFYPSGNVEFSLNRKFSKSFQLSTGLGIQGYGFVNKGPIDNYTFDFISPHAFIGSQYIFPTRKNYNGFVRISSGLNYLPNIQLTEIFPDYEVDIMASQKLNPYLQMGLGVTNRFKQRIGNAKQYLIWELGVSYRYQPNPFGIATFVDDLNVATAAPNGNSFGFFAKIYFPVGNQKVNQKRKKIKNLKKKKLKRTFNSKTVRKL